jgi:hypothetical protein
LLLAPGKTVSIHTVIVSTPSAQQIPALYGAGFIPARKPCEFAQPGGHKALPYIVAPSSGIMDPASGIKFFELLTVYCSLFTKNCPLLFAPSLAPLASCPSCIRHHES